MRRLIEFIRSVYVVVLFVVLELIAINFYAHSTLYTQAKMLSYSNKVVGSAQGVWGGTRGYLNLRKDNDRLLSRLTELERELSSLRHTQQDSTLWASSQIEEITDTLRPYNYIRARVVSNSINRLENYITINRGHRDGVHKNMAIVTPSAEMVGYVVACSENYSIAISILNIKFRTSGKIKGQEYMGSISWRGESRYRVEMSELSKYANISVGDTIISTGHSQIFPEGILVGHITAYELNRAGTAYSATIELGCEVSAVNEVLIVGNNSYIEIENLQKEVM